MPDRVWKTGNTKSTENAEGKRGVGDRKQGSTRGNSEIGIQIFTIKKHPSCSP